MATLTLYELNEFIRRVIALNFSDYLWVTAEIAQINTSRGHIYIELVQKEDNDIIAQLPAVIWQGELKRIKKKNGEALDVILTAGKEMRCRTRVEFHERYGLKLIIDEIDATYTFGVLALQRQQLIAELQAKNLLNKNASISLPEVLQRIAIISSPQAAGLQDFLKHLGDNNYGYDFKCHLFEAAVQGQYAERDILKQLEIIELRRAEFDAVVLIRGGGSKLDLSVFDSRILCLRVAKFKLPIISGIGHETDQSVLDMVSHSTLKTPTAVADFILIHNAQFEIQIINIGKFISDFAQSKMREADLELKYFDNVLKIYPTHILEKSQNELSLLAQNLQNKIEKQIQSGNFELIHMENALKIVGIDATLKRGFTITKFKSKEINGAKKLKLGDKIETKFYDGDVSSVVV